MSRTAVVFIIQNTQNRESSALQLKVDELLRAVRGAHNTFINLEELSEEDLDDLKEKSAALAERARLKAGRAQAPGRTASRTASPGATPARLCEHTMRVVNQPSK